MEIDVYINGFHIYRGKIVLVLFFITLVPIIILTAGFVGYHIHYRKKIENKIFQDKVTGLYTRVYYENYVNRKLKELQGIEDTFTVIMIDIDDFKAYNDYYGHVKGDEILKYIGRAIRLEAESVGGCPGRYGGEEFVVFVPSLRIVQGNLLCENIRKSIENLKLQYENRDHIKIVTVSLGIYTYSTQSTPIELNALIDKADKALYNAKKAGKNCFKREK